MLFCMTYLTNLTFCLWLKREKNPEIQILVENVKHLVGGESYIYVMLS